MRARGRANVKLYLAAVDQGIEVASDIDEHGGPERQHQDGDDRRDGAPLQQGQQKFGIAIAQPIEAALERSRGARENT